MENQNKIEETESKKIKLEPRLFFPPSLRFKTLSDQKCTDQVKGHLEKYLKTEHYRYLFKAIKADPNILQGEKTSYPSLALLEPYPSTQELRRLLLSLKANPALFQYYHIPPILEFLKAQPNIKINRDGIRTQDLIKAIENNEDEDDSESIPKNKIFHSILTLIERHLNKEADKTKDKSLKVDACSVVWETINYWRYRHYICRVFGSKAEELERLLINIGRSLIPTEFEVTDLQGYGDLFVHATPKNKGKGSPTLRYRDEHELIKYWNEVDRVFSSLSDKFKDGATKPLLEELRLEREQNKALVFSIFKKGLPKVQGIMKIIEEEFNENITVEEIKRFDTSTKKNIAYSYIAWKHEKNCGICSKRKTAKVCYRTVNNLIKQAMKSVKNTPQKNPPI